MDRCDVFYPRRIGGYAYLFLPPRTSVGVRMATHCQTSARTAGDPRLRRERIQLDHGHRAGLWMPVRNRQTHFRPVVLGLAAAGDGGGVRLLSRLASCASGMGDALRERTCCAEVDGASLAERRGP